MTQGVPLGPALFFLFLDLLWIAVQLGAVLAAAAIYTNVRRRRRQARDLRREVEALAPRAGRALADLD